MTGLGVFLMMGAIGVMVLSMSGHPENIRTVMVGDRLYRVTRLDKATGRFKVERLNESSQAIAVMVFTYDNPMVNQAGDPKLLEALHADMAYFPSNLFKA